jgi:hypothetical protein
LKSVESQRDLLFRVTVVDTKIADPIMADPINIFDFLDIEVFIDVEV